jgi:hypothetical protein
MKMATLPKSNYMINTFPIIIPMMFTGEIEKSTLKFIWKHKATNSQSSSEQKGQHLEVSQYQPSQYTSEPQQWY